MNTVLVLLTSSTSFLPDLMLRLLESSCRHPSSLHRKIDQGSSSLQKAPQIPCYRCFSVCQRPYCITFRFWDTRRNIPVLPLILVQSPWQCMLETSREVTNSYQTSVEWRVGLKGLCQLASMRAEVMHIIFGCQIFNGWLSLSRPR